ncbi:hypothetical protein TNCV_4557961 [Trichonephila clavipes]|nr:hypothetical protein TNCV_4557961 [Trichonephila clavipes]
MSQFVKYCWKKSPGRLHTWKNDRKLEEGRTVTSVAAEFGINKSVVSRAWKSFQITGEKEADGSQQASLLSKSSTATGRQVSRFTVARTPSQRWPYSLAVLNPASR